MEDINRFLKAQENAYPRALKEIKNGRKESHWMWYIFPQIVGLGNSDIATYYSIKSLKEAKAYLENETLRNHLLEISKELLKIEGKEAGDIFGGIDSLKLKSSMTLFGYVDPEEETYKKVLEKYYEGQEDEKTLEFCKKR